MYPFTHYFPNLTDLQQSQFEKALLLYQQWNAKINVISRKDIQELAVRHFLHSLSIAKVCQFSAQSQVIDIGTGGGFPGIPLAILLPEVRFFLVDSVGKKIKVATEIAQELGLTNVVAQQARVETITQKFDFAVSRAVTQMPQLVEWTKKVVKKNKGGKLFCLKGGDLTEELAPFPQAKIHNLTDFFAESFFETKKIVELSL